MTSRINEISKKKLGDYEEKARKSFPTATGKEREKRRTGLVTAYKKRQKGKHFIGQQYVKVDEEVALGGGLHLYNKAKEWRSNVRSMRREGKEIDTYLEEILDETGLTPDELGALFEEIDDQEDAQYELFSAIMAEKPHDAMEVMDALMKDKLGHDIEDYKKVLADVMFNPHNYEEDENDEEVEGEGEPESEEESNEQIDEVVIRTKVKRSSKVI